MRVVALEENRGFAAAVNRGMAAVGPECEAIALVNTDVELSPDWAARTVAVLEGEPRVAAVATKMVSPREEGVLDDCGDVLRRDGACEQRGARGGPTTAAGTLPTTCSARAPARRSTGVRPSTPSADSRSASSPTSRTSTSRFGSASPAGRCRYEPVVARHWGSGAGGGGGPARPINSLVERNTLLLCARAFLAVVGPGPMLYRRVALAVGPPSVASCGPFWRGARAALPLLPRVRARARRAATQGRRADRAGRAQAPDPRPRAGGHPQAGF